MNSEQKKALAKKLTVLYVAAMIAYYVANTLLLSFMVDLLQFQHVQTGNIALLVGLAYLLSMFVQSGLSSYADAHPRASLSAMSASLMGLLCILLFLNRLLAHVNPLLSAGFFVVMAMLSASNPALINAISTRYQALGIPVSYSVGRGGGSIACAATGLGLGLLVDAKGAGVLFVVGICAAAAAAVLVLLLPPASRYAAAPPQTRTKEEHDSLTAVLRRNPALTLFLLTSIVMYASMNGAWTYQKSLIAAVGGGTSLYGVSLLIVAGCELPMAFLFPKVVGRVPITRLLLVSVCAYALKPVVNLIGLSAGSLPVLFAACAMHLLASGIMFPGCVYFTNRMATDRDRVRIQALTAMTMGIGATIGNFISSFAYNLGGLTAVLSASILLGFFALGGYGLMCRTLRQRTKKTA